MPVFPDNSHDQFNSPFSSRDHLLSNPALPENSTFSRVDAGVTARSENDGMAWFTIRTGADDSRFASAPSRRTRTMTRQRRIALLKSYAVDWLVCIVLAAVFFSLNKVPGFKRQFSIDDPSLRFPFAVHERVPPVGLYFIAVVAPFVIQIVVNLISVHSLWDFHNSSLGLLLSLTLTGAITQFTKITVGRPRPDVISRCQPPSGVQNPEYGLVSVAICRQTDEAILRDGWRSFPSGHSSLSFAGLGFLSFYLAGKMHLFDEKGHTTKAWVSLTPLSGAALVAISRTMDYRHHWQDVLVGSALGLAMAFFSYRQYYPALSSPRAHHPFSPRIRRERDDALGQEGAGVMNGVRSSSASSEESRTPILPVVRPGLGKRGENHSLRKSRTGGSDDGPSPVGMEGSSGYGGHARDDSEANGGDDGTAVTHPVVPHIHPLHGGHPQSRDLLLHNLHDEHTGDDLRPQSQQRRSDGPGAGAGERQSGSGSGSAEEYENEGVELNGPLNSSGSGWTK